MKVFRMDQQVQTIPHSYANSAAHRNDRGKLSDPAMPGSWHLRGQFFFYISGKRHFRLSLLS
jgi:hypothetical protein